MKVKLVCYEKGKSILFTLPGGKFYLGDQKSYPQNSSIYNDCHYSSMCDIRLRFGKQSDDPKRSAEKTLSQHRKNANMLNHEQFLIQCILTITKKTMMLPTREMINSFVNENVTLSKSDNEASFSDEVYKYIQQFSKNNKLDYNNMTKRQEQITSELI